MLIFGREVPVVPGDGAVLAVGIIVAALATAQFVAPQQHGHTLGQQECGQKVALLPLAQGKDFGVVGVALFAAVPGAVVAFAVAVVFLVGIVVLVVVAHQIPQGEAVVTGDEVDTGVGALAVGLVKVGTACDPKGKFPQAAVVIAPKVSQRVTILAVPLRPQ